MPSCNSCFPTNPAPFLSPFVCFVPFLSFCLTLSSQQPGFLFLQHLSFMIPHLSKGLEAPSAVNTNSNDTFRFFVYHHTSASPLWLLFLVFIFLSNFLNFICFWAVNMLLRKKIHSSRWNQSSAQQTVFFPCSSHKHTHTFLVTKCLTAYQMLDHISVSNKMAQARHSWFYITYLCKLYKRIPPKTKQFGHHICKLNAQWSLVVGNQKIYWRQLMVR